MTYNRTTLITDLEGPSGEGLRLKPYVDTAGKLSIGVGRNLDDKGISKTEADFLLADDLNDVEAILDQRLPWWRTLTDARQRVLVELCFNMGWGGLSSFSETLGLIHGGDYATAADHLSASTWAKEVQATRVARITNMMRNG